MNSPGLMETPMTARAHWTKGGGSHEDGMGAGPWLSLGPSFVYFSISLARTETTTWLLTFLFSWEPPTSLALLPPWQQATVLGN